MASGQAFALAACQMSWLKMASVYIIDVLTGRCGLSVSLSASASTNSVVYIVGLAAAVVEAYKASVCHRQLPSFQAILICHTA